MGTSLAPVYHDTDRMGTWHEQQQTKLGNYFSVSGSVEQAKFSTIKGAQADVDWQVILPNRDTTGILAAGEVGYGWFNEKKKQ